MSITINFVCIRHAESLANVHLHDAGKKSDYSEEMTKKIQSAGPDPELSERGLKQAQATANALASVLKISDDETYVRIFASPMKRVQQTLSAFQLAGQPLHQKKVSVRDSMIEYDRTTHENFATFVDTVVDFFVMLHRQVEMSCENQTVLLFGHSLFFSTLFHVLSSYHPSVTIAELQNIVKRCCCDPINEKRGNAAFHLPNCSISTFQATMTDKVIEWKILNIGKADHVPADIRTGQHALF